MGMVSLAVSACGGRSLAIQRETDGPIGSGADGGGDAATTRDGESNHGERQDDDLARISGEGGVAADDATEDDATANDDDPDDVTNDTDDADDIADEPDDITDQDLTDVNGPAIDPLTGCGVAGSSQVPRLTPAEYDRTLRDLLGVTAVAGGEPPSSLFGQERSGPPDMQIWLGYQRAAEVVSLQVMANPEQRSGFLECSSADLDEACLRETIATFGRRAFRRPLTEAEKASFERLIINGAEITEAGTPDEIAELILYTFLVSPSFLMRSEFADPSSSAGLFGLSSHEVAARLSYMLWGSAPDETLNIAADSGELTTPVQILTQAARMVQDPKAADLAGAFHRHYLGVGPNTRWAVITKDTTVFPEFSEAMVPAMLEETELFFDRAFRLGSSFQDLLLSSIAFVNAQTAPLYDLDPGSYAEHLTEVALWPDQRPGFLTRVGFLSAFSGRTQNSPSLRGQFVMREVLGLDVGVPSHPIDTYPEEPYNTVRERVYNLTDSDACRGCHHTYIDPPGYVLEAFDSLGRWQTVDATSGAPIDTVADVLIEDELITVTDASDLMQKLAASSHAQRTYARKWVEFFYRRFRVPADACTIDELAANIATGDYSILNLLVDLTQTESFRARSRLEEGAW
jgi:hypothetical protein